MIPFHLPPFALRPQNRYHFRDNRVQLGWLQSQCTAPNPRQIQQFIDQQAHLL